MAPQKTSQAAQEQDKVQNSDANEPKEDEHSGAGSVRDESDGSDGSDDNEPELSRGSSARESTQDQPPTPVGKPTRQVLQKRKRKFGDPWGRELDAKKQMTRREKPEEPEQPQPQPQTEQPAQIQVADQNNGKKNPLTVRLDLNLEVEIELHAKIHGDVTLTLT